MGKPRPSRSKAATAARAAARAAKAVPEAEPVVPGVPPAERGANGAWLPGGSGNPSTVIQPGQALNPAGRPPDSKRMQVALDKYLSRIAKAGGKPVVDEDTGLPMTFEQFVVQRWVLLACRGNATALRELLDRTDGKVRQVLGIEGTGGPPVVVEDERERLQRYLSDLAGVSDGPGPGDPPPGNPPPVAT